MERHTMYLDIEIYFVCSFPKTKNFETVCHVPFPRVNGAEYTHTHQTRNGIYNKPKIITGTKRLTRWQALRMLSTTNEHNEARMDNGKVNWKRTEINQNHLEKKTFSLRSYRRSASNIVIWSRRTFWTHPQLGKWSHVIPRYTSAYGVGVALAGSIERELEHDLLGDSIFDTRVHIKVSQRRSVPGHLKHIQQF